MPKRVRVIWVITSIVILLGFFFTSIRYQSQQAREVNERRAEEANKAYEARLAKKKIAMELTKQVNDIREMVASGKNAEAIALAKKVVEKDPNSAMAHTWWAVALVNQKQVDEGLATFNKSVAIDPNQAKTYSFWGLTLAKLGRHKEAIDKYENALLLDPQSSNGYTYWGAALGQLDKHEQAVEKLKKALELNPYNELANGILVDSYFHLGQFEDAWQAVKDAEKVKLKIPEGTLKRLRNASPEPG